MKIMMRVVLLILITGTYCLLSQTRTENETIPEIYGIISVSEDEWWSIDELRTAAINYLMTNGSMPKDLKLSTRVVIFPRDAKRMCQFDFSQGLEKPFWLVDVGYDGKAFHFEKRIAKEVGLGHPDPRAPRNGKLPKGARLAPSK